MALLISHKKYSKRAISNSYTMGCPPVRGDNPRALAGGLSYVLVDKLFYTTYISVDLAHHEIFHVKVGKGGINKAISSNDRSHLLTKLIVEWIRRQTVTLTTLIRSPD